MLYCADSSFSFCQYCTSGCFHNIISHSIYNWLPLHINTLYFVPVIVWSRVEGYGEFKPGVKTFST